MFLNKQSAEELWAIAREANMAVRAVSRDLKNIISLRQCEK